MRLAKSASLAPDEGGNQHAINMQSACNQHAISMAKSASLAPPLLAPPAAGVGGLSAAESNSRVFNAAPLKTKLRVSLSAAALSQEP